jgi:hypothetical protein
LAESAAKLNLVVNACDAMAEGASDFLTKPVNDEDCDTLERRLFIRTGIENDGGAVIVTVLEFSIHSSNAEIAAAAIALQENNKYIGLWRCLHQTAR